MIIFVTTCKGRAQHIEQTLPRNLADNADFPDCKFVVLDYSSQDHLQEYLLNNHAKDIETGRLVVYSYPGAERFHVAHAKNLAARCGLIEGADILVTLDADNYTGPGFARWVADNLTAPRTFLCPDFPLIQSLPHGPDRPLRGFAGRLAIRAQDFIKMGGYDETYDTWRGEDIDMISRLLRTGGYTMKHIPTRLLGAIPHSAEVRFAEYPHARQYENRREVKIIDARKETVVNFGRFGLGTVYRNYRWTPIELTPVPTRVFGIGLQKTGTSSLHEAFKILGYDSFHWGEGESPVIWHEMQTACRSKMLERWYAACDLPIPLLYKRIDRAYPGSKFILTIRDEGDWLKSVEGLWDPKRNPTRWVWDKYPFTNRVHTALYGQANFDPGIFLATYRRHNAEVREYFRDRPGDLLVMNIDAGKKWDDLHALEGHRDDRQGWNGICRFLCVPLPRVPYPRANVTGGAPAVSMEAKPQEKESKMADWWYSPHRRRYPECEGFQGGAGI